jgi:hypothetical protein
MPLTTGVTELGRVVSEKGKKEKHEHNPHHSMIVKLEGTEREN